MGQLVRLTNAAKRELFVFFSSRRRHTRWSRDWSSDVCSSDLVRRAGRRDSAQSAAAPIGRWTALDYAAQRRHRTDAAGDYEASEHAWQRGPRAPRAPGTRAGLGARAQAPGGGASVSRPHRGAVGCCGRSIEGVRRAVASARLAVTLLHELLDRLPEQGERERLVEGEAKRRLCRAISFQPAVAARRLGWDEHRDVLLERCEVDEPTFVSRAAVLVERDAVADALGGFRRRALDHLPQPFEPRAYRGRCGGDVGADALGFFHVNSLL